MSNDKKKIKLEVAALSHSITHSHSYAVVLGEVGGPRRLPVVIGAFEAQAIAIAIEKMTPSRPLTHDLMKHLCEAFDVTVESVVINNLADGIFYSQLVCKKGKETIEVDSRTSDALALALRFDCPIYTYEFILDSAGIVFEDSEKEGATTSGKRKSGSKPKPKDPKKADLTKYKLKELESMLSNALKKEDYESAIAIRDEISRRQKDS